MNPLEILSPTPQNSQTNSPSAEMPAPAPPPEVLAHYDETLTALWDEHLTTALQAAEALYAPDDAEEEDLPQVQEEVAANFWRLLMHRCKALPDTPALRYREALAAGSQMLQIARTSATLPFAEDYLAVALRPVRRLKAGTLTGEVCAVLYDYHRGVWTPHLTRPQLFKIQDAVAKTLNALPPDAMGEFWVNLRSDEPMRRHAMLLGVEMMRNTHAVPHLLRGLEHCPHHDSRTVLVDALEQIPDPHSLETLMRLRRETASTDWTLSRQLARAIRAIEQQNRNQNQQMLLRPSDGIADPPEALLRPASDSTHPSEEKLLRPAASPDKDP